MASKVKTIRVALDWTPNTIHSGLYLAHAQSLYSDAGINVELLAPDPSYSKTPAKRLEAGEVDLAICPSDSVIAYAESNKPDMKLQAIYAILQKDASAIVATKDGLKRPRDLEDGRYGSYNARYEDHIVKAMVSNDGGDASRLEIVSDKGKLSLFEELKKGNVDATWVFLPWEGVDAQMSDVALNIFRTEDSGIPYGYSPVIARNTAKSLPDDVLSKFVEATRQGYAMAIERPEAAVDALKDQCDPERSSDFLLSSQQDINQYYSDGSSLGSMKLERWQTWVDWLKSKNLVAKEELSSKELFSNQYFSLASSSSVA